MTYNYIINWKEKMNIYTFLMSRDKCQTFFPKLQIKIDRDTSTKHQKKQNQNKLRNKSFENDGKFHMTYHEILKLPNTTDLVKQKTKGQKYLQMKSTFMKKPMEARSVHTENPSKIKGYQILNQIGKGGFAEVLQVKDEQDNRYAMKQYILQNSMPCYKNQYLVGEHFFENGKLRNKFAKIRGGNHIIKFIQKIKVGKKGYIIQELGGKSLTKSISEIHGVFHKGQRVYQVKLTKFYEKLTNKSNFSKILLQICHAVKLLNSQGFIHCDLKPENILVDSQNDLTCKVIDFGSAFLHKEGLPKITITPQYMPPQLLDALDNDSNTETNLQKIDIWSIGCIMLEIMTGIPLWFRYKCKLEVGGRESIQLGFFALTNREYRKIIRKQKQICQTIKKITFIYSQFQAFRKILLRILVFDQSQRATIDQIIQLLQTIH